MVLDLIRNAGLVVLAILAAHFVGSIFTDGIFLGFKIYTFFSPAKLLTTVAFLGPLY